MPSPTKVGRRNQRHRPLGGRSFSSDICAMPRRVPSARSAALGFQGLYLQTLSQKVESRPRREKCIAQSAKENLN